MSILSGFKRFKRYTKTSDGYIPSYEKTIANAVCFGDGTDDNNTVEKNLSAIKGITTSTAVTETGYAADAKVVSELNSNLQDYVKLIVSDNISIELDADDAGEYTANFVIPYGYKLLDLMHFNSNGRILCTGRYNITQTSMKLWLVNIATLPTTATGNAILLCIRE